jgi:hypothetical protein
VSELDNALVHLTNVAVQKGAPGHDPDGPGGKWALENLRLHLEAIRGHAATEALFADIEVRRPVFLQALGIPRTSKPLQYLKPAIQDIFGFWRGSP